MSALTGFRVVELAESVAGEYCGKLLADFGAEVIKIERPGSGSPARAFGGGPFAYFNTKKQSVELDATAPAVLATLYAFIATADAVIDDHPGPSMSELPDRHPGVVFCSIT